MSQAALSGPCFLEPAVSWHHAYIRRAAPLVSIILKYFSFYFTEELANISEVSVSYIAGCRRGLCQYLETKKNPHRLLELLSKQASENETHHKLVCSLAMIRASFSFDLESVCTGSAHSVHTYKQVVHTLLSNFINPSSVVHPHCYVEWSQSNERWLQWHL